MTECQTPQQSSVYQVSLQCSCKLKCGTMHLLLHQWIALYETTNATACCHFHVSLFRCDRRQMLQQSSVPGILTFKFTRACSCELKRGSTQLVLRQWIVLCQTSNVAVCCNFHVSLFSSNRRQTPQQSSVPDLLTMLSLHRLHANMQRNSEILHGMIFTMDANVIGKKQLPDL